MRLPTLYANLSQLERREVREKYKELQDGKCWYCGEYLDFEPSYEVLSKSINKNLFPPDFFKYPIHLHHNHVTGLTIGVTHCECNAVLWQYHKE